MYQAKIYITLRESVLDPQGTAVRKALDAMGYSNIKDVRIGRYLLVDIDTYDKALAESQAHDMCKKLLANPVIEDYKLEIVKID